MRKLVLALPLIAASAFPAAAQQMCGPHQEIVKELEEKHGESLAMLGLSVKGHIVNVYVNDKTGSFTVLLTRPDGVSCFVDAGEAGQRVKPKATGPEL